MTKPTPEIPYRALLTPEILAMLDKSARQKVTVPTFITRGDIAALLKQKELGDITKGMEKVDNSKIPIDDRIKETIASPKKENIGMRGENSLTIAFSILGYASVLGRKINVIMTSVDNNGQMDFSKKVFQGHISPEIFEHFQSSALEGAKMFFSNAADTIDNPKRMVVMAFISPNADIDG